MPVIVTFWRNVYTTTNLRAARLASLLLPRLGCRFRLSLDCRFELSFGAQALVTGIPFTPCVLISLDYLLSCALARRRSG